MRCTGHCCRDFSLPYFPDEFKRRHKHIVDGVQIYRMVIYIGIGHLNHAGQRVKYYPRYTCRNYNSDKKECEIYEDRPAMCRDYPYRGQTCTYPGCTFSGKDVHTHHIIQGMKQNKFFIDS